MPFLLESFSRVMVLPMFASGIARTVSSKVQIIQPSSFSAFKTVDFLRGLRCAGNMFTSEWKRSPQFPFSPYGLYLTARTLGIACRIDQQIRESAHAMRLLKQDSGIIYSYWMNQASIGAIMAARKLGWPVVCRAHGGDLYTERYPNNYLPWHDWKVRNMDYVLPVSEDGLRYLLSRYPEKADQVRVFRLGVRDPLPEMKEKKTGHCDTVAPFHLVSCSSVIPLKRVELIFETAVALHKLLADTPGSTGSRIRWTHIGGGPGYAALKKRALSTTLPGLQIHLPGHLPTDRITSYYQEEEADLFINYSTSEGIPVTIMEAFSCGIPAAAPRTGAIPEIVDSETGIPFDVHARPTEVARLIRDALTDRTLQLKGKNARLRWKKDYDHSANYRCFTHFLIGLTR